jgi:hypothetical protein
LKADWARCNFVSKESVRAGKGKAFSRPFLFGFSPGGEGDGPFLWQDKFFSEITMPDMAVMKKERTGN